MATTIIKAVDLSKQLPGPEGLLSILDTVNFSVDSGQALAIIGPSGSGKSSLLGLLAGLDTPSSGQVELFGQDLSLLDEDGRAALRAGQLGFVFQSFQLLPHLTALENVTLPMELAGMKNAEDISSNMLIQVGLAARLHHYPNQLSGGEQQRVALARAFVIRPKLLFADEPTGNLDHASGERVIELLFQLRAEHETALVLVTHDQQLAARCDQRYRMDAGRLSLDA